MPVEKKKKHFCGRAKLDACNYVLLSWGRFINFRCNQPHSVGPPKDWRSGPMIIMLNKEVSYLQMSIEEKSTLWA